MKCAPSCVSVFSSLGGRVYLGAAWILGLLLGVYSGCRWDESLVPLMHGCLYDTVSIVCVFCLLCLPFMISLLASFWNVRWLIYLIAFGKAFLFSFVSLGVFFSFGAAGWLVQLLLMFSEVCSLPVLYWFWMYCLDHRQGPSPLEIFSLLSLFFLIASLNCSYVMPFLASLIS